MTDKAVSDLLLSLERQLLSPGTRGSGQDLDRLLDDSFVEFGASGRVFDKAAIIADLEGESSLTATMSNEAVRFLSPTLALLTYTCSASREGNERITNRSSIWQLKESTWRVIFHQGTVVGSTEN